MDWSKAKNILIAALLITNLLLGGAYYKKVSNENALKEESAENTRIYLESKNVAMDCEISTEESKMPVLFVRIEKGPAEEQSAEGYRLIVSGSEKCKAIPLRFGDTKAKTISSATAMQYFISRYAAEIDFSDLQISDLQLVYWLDRNDIVDGSREDTAVPAWEISSNQGRFYIEAFAK